MPASKAEAIRQQLDPARLRELFDLQGANYETRGGGFEGDLYAPFRHLRETGPVHEGVPGPLVGYHGPAFFQCLPEPDRPHFGAYDYETCEYIYRHPELYGNTPPEVDGLTQSSILYMDGERHHRYRILVQPSFVPKRAQWWITNWVQDTVDALVDNVVAAGRADLNVDVFAAIPLLTICGSFGVTVAQALDIREAVTSDGLGMAKFLEVVTPLVPQRREEPGDDLLSVLLQAELTDDHGGRQVLTDGEILGFTFLLLAAGSGTTWKQMGITMLALLEHPEWLERLKADRSLMKPCIEEAIRWMPTDPVFGRFVMHDTTLGGVDIPAGAVMHPVLGAANRDPERWSDPDTFDPGRPQQGHFGFGFGPHTCLGMHVARAEIATALNAILDRCPGIRLDPDAPAPKVTGMYERGPTAVPVMWDV